jgi:hypothetical protein
VERYGHLAGHDKASRRITRCGTHDTDLRRFSRGKVNGWQDDGLSRVSLTGKAQNKEDFEKSIKATNHSVGHHTTILLFARRLRAANLP